MEADREEERIQEAARDMRGDARDMERASEELGEQIDEARAAAARRPDAPERTGLTREGAREPLEDTGTVAGDWRGESSGSQQGEGPSSIGGEHRGADESGEADEAD